MGTMFFGVDVIQVHDIIVLVCQYVAKEGKCYDNGGQNLT